MEKNASEVEKSKIFEILDFKIFCLFSQFLNEFQLQVSGPSQQARWDIFFEYWNFYFTFLKARVMIKTFWKKFLKFTLKWHFPLFWALDPPKVAFESQSCWHTGIQVIICLGFHGEGFWVKKVLSRALWKCPFLPKTRFWSCFSLLDPYFWLNFPPIVPIFCWPICCAPIGTFWGVLGRKISS